MYTPKAPLTRHTHGLLLIDKPKGMSSHKCVQVVKGITCVNKAGHTGTLDPLATGLLPVCCNKATRLAEYMLLGDKSYEGTVHLGSQTTTADSEGDIVAQASVPDFDQTQLDDLAQSLTGDLEQTPPNYSAIKVHGTPMYQLARQSRQHLPGLKSRTVHIYTLSLTDISNNQDRRIDIKVHCSKGTYVRTLAETIAHRLGTLGHLCSLRRTACGTFNIANAITLEQLATDPYKAAFWVSMERMVSALPSIELDDAQRQQITKGIALNLPVGNLHGTIALLFTGRLVALAKADNNSGTLAPVKVFCE